jgi:hypothetical protein
MAPTTDLATVAALDPVLNTARLGNERVLGMTSRLQKQERRERKKGKKEEKRAYVGQLRSSMGWHKGRQGARIYLTSHVRWVLRATSSHIIAYNLNSEPVWS